MIHQRYLPILLVLLGSLLWHAEIVHSKEYLRCQLAMELKTKYLISSTYLSNWICMVEHESQRKTNVVTTKPNGSSSYGLFQINSKQYCRLDRAGGLCKKKCSDFIDDNIDDDVECAKVVWQEEGFNHWQGWKSYCKLPNNLPNLQVVCNPNSFPGPRTRRLIKNHGN